MNKSAQIEVGRVISTSKTLPILECIKVEGEYYPNPEVPTLVIGKKRAEELFGKENLHVLDKKLDNNLFWTFAKNERRVDFEEDIEKFNNIVADNILRGVEYTYYNIFTEEAARTRKFIEWLYKGGKKVLYIFNKHIYACSYSVPNKVFGISLNDIEYIGKDSDSVLRKIKENPKNTILYDDDFIEQKTRLTFMDSRYLIPYLYIIQG